MRRALVLVLVVCATAVASWARGPLAAHPTPLPGLKSAAEIVRDRYGIAHLRANHESDLYFLQGYVHAEDRLFQMDVSRRRASGTLAELLGPGALPGDVQLRTLGMRRAAEASLPVLAPRTRLALEAYARGVNRWVAENPLPPEYGPLELTRFEAWTAVDSVAIAKLLALGLSFDLDDIERTVALLTYQAVGSAVGFDGTALFFEDAFRSAPFDPASTIPDATAPAPAVSAAREESLATAATRLGEGVSEATLELSRRYLERVRAVPFLRRILDGDRRPGSNEWAVSGERSRSGVPLLASDPHLALDAPSTFYPIHLRAGRLDVIGNSFPGAPIVATGHNRFIAWGATVNPMDVTDVYQEAIVPDPASPSGLSTLYLGAREPILPIPETFRANQIGNAIFDDLQIVPPAAGVPPFTLIVPRRNGGPLVEVDLEQGVGLSVQYTGFGPTRELDAFFLWNRATGLEEFVRGLQHFDFGSQNFAYADVHGNIAYFTSAEMPVREDLQAGFVAGLPPYFIRNGGGGNEWLPLQNPQPGQSVPFEILPFAEMPKLVNPPNGWFVNANNDPAGTSLDNNPLNQLRPEGGIFYLNPGYDGFRGGRITQMVRELLSSGDGKISFDEMQAMQADVVLIDAQFFAPHIVGALEHAREPDAHPALAALAALAPVAEAVERLAAWDFSTPTGLAEGYDAADFRGRLAPPDEDEIAHSVAATLYSVWRGRFLRNTIDGTLAALGLPRPPDGPALASARVLLEQFATREGRGLSGVNFFNVPGVPAAEDRRDILILKSMADALELLAGEAFAPAFGGSMDLDDYRWGKLHRIVFDHPLGPPFDIPPAGGAFEPPLAGLRGIPTDGGFGVVDASSHRARAAAFDSFMFGSGPSNRFVAALSADRGVRAQSAWPGGTSGVLGSPYYVNLLPLWLTNDAIPLLQRRADLVRQAESVERFVPAPRRRGHLERHPRGQGH